MNVTAPPTPPNASTTDILDMSSNTNTTNNNNTNSMNSFMGMDINLNLSSNTPPAKPMGGSTAGAAPIIPSPVPSPLKINYDKNAAAARGKHDPFATLGPAF